ncbi:hypothetical protein QTI33_34730 [Variovorax sp. J22P271]|uniref:hypothetical protein n=1 Tax=Variovorax davisae TaxID=3053515 RepID=UPI0025777E0F|nr:hypothetical protein [Variovorax sp. J22P271]MDM0037325.1 hypothetical protein [Variovorax sp. J22P271]
MTFSELPVGAEFRFWRRGTLLTKISESAYFASLIGLQEEAAPDAEVLTGPGDIASDAPLAGVTEYDLAREDWEALMKRVRRGEQLKVSTLETKLHALNLAYVRRNGWT